MSPGRTTRARRTTSEHARFARALDIIRAASPDELRDPTPTEARAVRATSAWRYDSPGVLGLAVGRRFTNGEPTDEMCIQVFVDRKLPPEELARSGRAPIAPVPLDEPLPVDVIEVGAPVLHAPSVGAVIGAGSHNPGTLTAFLSDRIGQVFGLSAAHVLCESILDGEDHRRRRRSHAPGDLVFDYTPSAGLPESSVRIGQLIDRALLDLFNVFTDQSVDAAIFRFDALDAADIDRAAIPYSSPRWPRAGESVRVLGAATGSAGAPGAIISSLMSVPSPGVLYADPRGDMRPVILSRLLLADYESFPGDSGGAVVSVDDGAIIGMHLGALPFRFRMPDGSDEERLMAFFMDIRRVLGRWHTLTLLTNDA